MRKFNPLLGKSLEVKQVKVRENHCERNSFKVRQTPSRH